MKSAPSNPPESLSRAESLACIPRQSDTIDWQELENGDIVFTYAIPLSRFFTSLHQKFSKNKAELPTKKLQLDQMGSFVWGLIDGERTVKDIIKVFATDYKVTSQEAETAVASFLKSLGQRGFIALYKPTKQ
ncbi:MAG: PqqD family protein [Desulfocapsa sp.]|nr:PqqD family protein [Desulfocapsa sp.]